MLCERCGKGIAEVFVVKICNGNRYEEHICRECAKELLPPEEAEHLVHGVGSDYSGLYQLQKALSDLFSPVLAERGEAAAERCPYCGSVLHGVPSEQVDKEENHRDIRTIKKMSESDRLRADMAEAVKGENYEYAAVLRDRIAEIEKREADGPSEAHE